LTAVSSTTSSTLGVTGPVTGGDSEHLLSDKVQLLIRHSPVGIGAALLVALLETTVLWGVADRGLLLLWVGSVAAATLIRLVIVIAYWRSPQTGGKASRWVWRICLGNLLSGLIWGSSILMLDPNWPMPQQVVLILAVAGLTAGAISAYAVVYPAFLAIHLPALVPVVSWFLMQGAPVYQLLGIILFIYMAGLMVIGHTHYRSIQRSLQLAMDNEQLVEQLTEANSNLESEIHQKQQAMDELGEEKERAQVTLHSIADGVITTNQQDQVLSMNAVAEQLTGWTTDEAQGRPLAQVFRVEEGNDTGHTPKERRSCNGEELRDVLGNQILRRRDGVRFYIKNSRSSIRGFDGRGFGSVIVFHDVTEQQEMTERLSFQASHDVLTGLINRLEFERFVEFALQSAKTNGARHCVCYADLDQFKIVNDTCGHVAGDELLRRLANGLPSLLRENDVFARLGGDEFGILLEDCSLEDATEFCERLRKYVSEHRFVWDGKVFEIGVSIGIVEITDYSESVASILSAADIACYAAKDMGRNQVHVYQRADSVSGRRHSEIELVSEITRAIKEDRLVLFFQDIVATNGKGEFQLHGEVLVRMHDEHGELVQPGLFLPAAERYNLMQSIDLWVIRNTFSWWSEQCAGHTGEQPGLVSINLSGSSIGSESFQDKVVALAEEYSIAAGTICFEITETAAISNFESATRFMKRLRTSGVKFALDDFGSGLSSFAYLKNLPVDYLKIDGSFVRDIVDDPVDREMVRAIHQVGRVMGIETIAEFVENEHILQHLVQIGVDYAQGYGIARPRPISEIKVLSDRVLVEELEL